MKVKNYIIRLVNSMIQRISPTAKEEFELMENWKKEYMDELNGLQQLQENKGLSAKYSAYKDYNPDQAWVQLQNKINAGKKDNVFQLSTSSKVWRVAAIFIFVAISFWAVQSSMFTPMETKEFAAMAEKLEVTLEDNSAIVLDSASVLVQNGFRKVQLKGRAFFDISKNPDNIFEIQTSNAKIQVLGTSFLVTTRENYTDIYVMEGKVLVSSGEEKIELVANQSVLVENNSLRYISSTKGVFSDWKKNVLTFDNVELVEVLKSVAKHYNVSLSLPENLSDASCTIKTKFKDATLENIMKELSLIARIKFSFSNKTLIIDQIQC